MNNVQPQGLVAQRIGQYEQMEAKSQQSSTKQKTTVIPLGSAKSIKQLFESRVSSDKFIPRSTPKSVVHEVKPQTIKPEQQKQPQPNKEMEIKERAQEVRSISSTDIAAEKLRIAREQTKQTVYISDYIAEGDLKQHHSVKAVEEQIQGGLGEGGTKIALKLLGKGRVLMFPKGATSGIGVTWKKIDQKANLHSKDFILKTWTRMVEEEVSVHAVLASRGLLSPGAKRVNVSLSRDDSPIPAYVSESFEELLSRGIYILEKNYTTSTWQEGMTVFKDPEDKFRLENWPPVLTKLLKDIAKICVYRVPIDNEGHDAYNLAIVKTPEGNHEARYFGFDFASKGGPIREVPKDESADLLKKKGEGIFRYLMRDILDYEFGGRYHKDSEEYDDLFNKLTEMCLPIIEANIAWLQGLKN